MTRPGGYEGRKESNMTIRRIMAAILALQVVTMLTLVSMGAMVSDMRKEIVGNSVVSEAAESLSVAQEEREVQEDSPPLYSQEEVALVAKTIYGEARGCSEAEKRLVAWCICNRVDNGYWGNTVEEVVTYPGAFYGYKEGNPMDESCVEVAQDVLTEWRSGKEADVLEPYATTSKYLYFGGDGQHNWFREEY